MTLPQAQRPQVFGTGLIALDVVISADPDRPIHSWAGGTCGNVLSILAMLGWDAYPIARMNGDPASMRVRADLKKWGVQLKFAACEPVTDTPIIIQHILRTSEGQPRHRFSWACPHCGSWLPSFKPVTTKSVEDILPSLQHTKAFFMDRLSRSALVLAKQASDSGAVVVFEPSAKSDERMLAEAVAIAHIVKYSDARFARVPGAMEKNSATLVEVQTLGEKGLRYRHKFGRGVSAWKRMDAVRATHLADTCGSGDWCTAGLISMSARDARVGLIESGEDGLMESFRFGQNLAAWNLGFEGARGAMYALSRDKLEKHVQALASGRNEPTRPIPHRRSSTATSIACPACPSGATQARTRKIALCGST